VRRVVAPYRNERPARTFFVPDLLLDLEDGVGRLDIERDGRASEGLDVQQHHGVVESHGPAPDHLNQWRSESVALARR